MNNHLVFGSRKATVATVGAAFVTFIMTVLPVLFPDIAPEIWAETSALLTQIISLYLISQGAVDLATNWGEPNQMMDDTAVIDIAPDVE